MHGHVARFLALAALHAVERGEGNEYEQRARHAASRTATARAHTGGSVEQVLERNSGLRRAQERAA